MNSDPFLALGIIMGMGSLLFIGLMLVYGLLKAGIKGIG